MRDAIRLYGRYIGISIRGQMQYRASFAMQAAAFFLVTIIEFCAIWALFDRFGSLRGWTLPEVAVLYGMVHIAFALAEGVARGFDVFPQMVRGGDFDRLLLRPRSTALQVAGQEMQLMRLGRLLQGLAVLLWGAASAGIAWTAARIGLLIAAIAGGACLFSGLFVLQATLAFWTIETLEIVNTVTYGGTETAQFPLSIYRPWFRRFFTLVVPLACVSYFPAHAILGRPDPLGTPPAWHWVSPAVGVGFLAVSLRIWQVGVRHYRSTGS
ncbi:MAG: ABC-2 family transporter protein [Armatimonadetes bacterium]|nr:ABC-2 family transporter protein [Armatimonadota bacterium]